MIKFRFLKTKLTLAYGGLLGCILAVISLASLVAIENTARGKIEDEMQATSSVYRHLWSIRSVQLEESAGVIAKDFGFREAVATSDIATVASALENLAGRLDVDAAMIVMKSGETIRAGQEAIGQVDPVVWSALQAFGSETGVIKLGDQPYQVVSVPVRAPHLVGWVMFGSELGPAKMAELEKLSSIPLNASVVFGARTADPAAGGGKIVIRDSVIPGFGDLPDARLMLQYPLAAAMAPFRMMLYAILIMAAGGIIALLSCSWFISRSVTGPITKLDHAAQELARGRRVDIDVETNDEIGRLAESFSRMADEIESREENILRLSLTDTESDLPNRRALQMKLNEFESAAADSVFCATVSPDRFSKIMAVIGQFSTNELIATLGKRIETQDNVEIIGRLGTDLVGLIVKADSKDEARTRLADIVNAVSDPIEISGEKVDIQLSVGFASQDADNRLGVIDRAVIALQQARERHAPIFEFDGEAYGDPSGTLSLMSEMIDGLEDGSVYMTYQPKVDLRSQEISCAEALLRWQHPVLGFVSPEEFVRTAEETGHIRPLSEWVLRQVKSERHRFRDAGFDLKIAVNLSGRLLTDTEFLDWSIAYVGDEACHYCFEVTETAVIDDPELALANIQKLRDAGIEISIDDYGSGLSSLSYLKQIPAHELKIDKSFVIPLSAGSSDVLLIKSTIDLAHSLGMTVTAEGVESADVLAMLSGMGADSAQGYFISRPVRPDDAIEFLKSFVGNSTETVKIRKIS